MRSTSKVKMVDNLANVAGSDLTAGYKAANIDESSDPKYYGFVDSDGNWFIQRVSSTDIDYSAGSSNYTANWTGRAGLSYGKFNTIF